MADKPTIRQLISPSAGLFSKMEFQFPEGIKPSELDIMFHANYGDRPVTPILETFAFYSFVDNDWVKLPDSALTALSGIALSMYKHRWEKLIALFELEYDPIHNFSDKLSETITGNNTVENHIVNDDSSTSTRTDNLSSVSQLTGTDTTTDTPNTTATETRDLRGTNSTDTSHDIYGFNSDNGSPESETTATGSNTSTGTVTTKQTGTDKRELLHNTTDTRTNSGTQTVVDSSNRDRTENETADSSRTRESSRIGNIGNHTTQQLMEEEIKVLRNNLFQLMLQDMKDFCCAPYYIV